jgi:hypothetical protein
MQSDMVTIGAEGIDQGAIIRSAEQAVTRKRDDGTYEAAGIDGKTAVTPMEFKTDEAFLGFFLESLRETAFVDISDFDIEEKRPRFSRALVRMKKTIWGLLKFYTYRLWSQQNQVNGLLLSAIEGIYDRHEEQVHQLEDRIAALEKRENKTKDA